MTLRRGIPGQSGTQWFFTEAGRPFSFYAVLGSHALRPALVPHVNTLLSSLTLSPAAVATSLQRGPNGTDRPLPRSPPACWSWPGRPRRRGPTTPPVPWPPCCRRRRRSACCARVVRVGALAEAALGVVALAFPRPATAALVAALLRSASSASWPTPAGAAGPSPRCGCFGRPDTPPTALHLVIDLVLAAAAAAVAAGAPVEGHAGDAAGAPALGRAPAALRQRGGALAHRTGPLRPGRAHRGAAPGPPVPARSS